MDRETGIVQIFQSRIRSREKRGLGIEVVWRMQETFFGTKTCRGEMDLFGNRLDKYECRMGCGVGILLSAQTMLNTLSGIMRMSESAGVLRYSWAQGLQQHRPTSTWTLTLWPCLSGQAANNSGLACFPEPPVSPH